MIDKINMLEKKYINCICNIYPGLGILWGYESGKYMDISQEAAERHVEALKSILSECDGLENIDYLKNNIEMRLFELTVLWKKVLPARCIYEATLDALLILWDDFVLYKYGVKVEIVEQRLKNSIPAIQTAIKIMKKREFSYLDLAYTEFAIKNALIALNKKKNEYGDIESLFSEALDKGHEFQKFVSEMKKNVEDVNKVYSYGSEIISQYIEKKSSGKIRQVDIERYYKDAVIHLRTNKLEICSKDSQCSVELISKLINEIYVEMKEYFGEMPDLTKNLKIVDNDNNYMNGGFFYVNALEEGKLMGYLFFSSKYKYESIEQLKMKIIHEIYPGHHYTKMSKLKNSQSDNMFRLWKEDIWFEGWAKYCEWFYAKKKQLPIFESNLSFMSLMFVLVMDLQFYGKTLKEVIQHAKEIGNIDTKKAKTLVVNAYRDWEMHVNYYTGFCYFLEKEKPSLEFGI